MKKILALLSILIFVHVSSYAQVPQGINYQGVARDAQGNAIGKTNVSVQITFLQSGSGVYQEHQTVTTDTFGLYSIVIGSPAAIVSQGAFSSIPWSAGNLMVQVDIDPLGGTNFATVSTMSLQSVPYALYAGSAANSGNGTVTSISVGPGLSGSPSNPITTAGTIDLPTFPGVAGQWGSPSSIPTFSVDSYGRITGVSTQSVSAGQVVVPGSGLTSSVSSNTIILNALNGSAMWNANQLQSVPMSSVTPNTNDILQYNGSSWTPSPFNGLPAGSSGQMLFNSGTGWIPTSISSLNFNGTSLGLGTTTPGANLDVVSTTTTPAIKATAGSGPAIVSNGPLQLNGALIDGTPGPGNNGDVLVSQGPGLAPKWLAASSGSLPAPQLGSLLFANTATTWAPTNPSQISSDGNSISVTNTNTVGTAGSFISTNAGALNAPALYVESNTSTGYGIKVQSNQGAGITVSSGGPYAIAGNLNNGSGDAVAGWLRNNTSGGYGIYGLVDNTSSGSAGYFENQNGANTQTVMQVVNVAGSTGKSATFNGGSGVQIDQLQVSNGASPGYVLTSSDNAGNASWQPAGAVVVSAPLVGNGSAGAPLQLALNNGNIFVGDPTNMAVPVTMSGDVSITNTGSTTVNFLQGVSVSSVPPALNQVLQYNGSQWAPTNGATVTSVAGAGPALSGTVTTSGVITANNSAALWNASQVQNTSVSSVPPTLNQVLQYNGAQWAPTTISGSAITGVWTTTGNSVNATDYIGTTNTQPLTIATSNTLTSQPIVFKTGGLATGNEKMRIDASGNVGIGATAPASQLHVFGSNPEIRVESSGGAFSSGFGIKTATQQWFIGQETGAAQIFRIKDVSSSIVRMEIEKSNGNVGINKVSPTSQLDVASSSTVTTISAANTGSAGSAGDFQVNNGSNFNVALNVNTTGTGNAGYFSIGNTSNNNAAIYSTTNGNGSAGVFNVSNPSGTGIVLDVSNAGLSQTGSFITNNSSNANNALYVSTNGTGNGGFFQISNGATTSAAVYATTNGLGGIAMSANSNSGNALSATANTGNAVFARNTSSVATIDATNNGGGFSGNFAGGQGFKTDGFTADLKIVPNGGLVMGGTDYFFIIPNGTTGNLTLPAANALTKGKVYVVKTLGTAYNCGGGTTYTSITGITGQNNFPANSVTRLVCDGTAWQAW